MVFAESTNNFKLLGVDPGMILQLSAEASARLAGAANAPTDNNAAERVAENNIGGKILVSWMVLLLRVSARLILSLAAVASYRM